MLRVLRALRVLRVLRVFCWGHTNNNGGGKLHGETSNQYGVFLPTNTVWLRIASSERKIHAKAFLKPAAASTDVS